MSPFAEAAAILDHACRLAAGWAGGLVVCTVIGLALATGLAVALAIGLAIVLERRARSRQLDSVGALPPDARPDLIVVLGCPPRTRRGRPSLYLKGRAEATVAAYHALPSVPILCSGRGLETEDEIAALAELLDAGRVPRSSIRFDPGARRTIDTIDHLTGHYPGERVLLVTQSFHLPRTLFLARARGVDAWGLSAPGPVPGWRVWLREGLGQLRAVWDVAWDFVWTSRSR